MAQDERADVMFTERRLKMQWPKNAWFFLSLFCLTVSPPPAMALEVKFCVPDCQTAAASVLTFNETALPQLVSGVYTTTLNVAGSVASFTIGGTSPKVVAQQSGTLQKITFSTMTITAPGTCSQASPCSIEAVATSAPNDFPLAKKTTGYPAGAVMRGFFSGTGDGDEVSMTATAGGLGGTVAAPTTVVINTDVVNATPGGSSADSATSLPRSCTGTPTCKFTSTSSTKSIVTDISETVQQKCEIDPATGLMRSECLTQLSTRLKITFKNPNNQFTVPFGVVTVDPESGVNPVAVLIDETSAPVAGLDTNLAVGSNDFALGATIKLKPGQILDPTKEVYVKVCCFGMAFPEGSFVREGSNYVFHGTIDDRPVAGVFRKRGASTWFFGLGVHNVQLLNLLPPSPLLTPVEITAAGPQDQTLKGLDLVDPITPSDSQ